MLLGVFLDQISKYLIVLYMELYQSVEVIPGVFNLTYIQNEGAAFGSMSNSPWVFMVLSTVMIVGILVYMLWKKPQSRLLMSALTMIVAGGIGNMIDRIRLGYVIDFLDFCAFPKLWKWTFNVADSFVVIGAGMIILWMILDMVREYKAEKAKRLAQGQDEQTAEKTVPDEAASDVTDPVQGNAEEVNAEAGTEEDNANE